MMKQQTVKRIFIPCDEWVYYKIYSGSRMADIILTDIIKPISRRFLSADIIDKWFFIRYSDPDPHLRVRFHYSNAYSINNIITEFNVVIQWSFKIKPDKKTEVELSVIRTQSLGQAKGGATGREITVELMSILLA